MIVHSHQQKMTTSVYESYQMINTVLQYFKDFSNQNIEGLAESFAEDIHLCDWNIDVSGKQNVLGAIKDIYSNVKYITVKPVYFYSNDKDWFACEIVIDGENAEAKQEVDDDGNTQMTLTWSLEVVDVIHINKEGKITSIKAYKR